MYRGLSDYLGRTNYFNSTRAYPGPVRSNSTPFGNFIARPGPGNTSGFGSVQTRSGSQTSVLVIGSLTAASSDDGGEQKAPSVSDENV